MPHKIAKENSINFLEIDYNNLGKEIKKMQTDREAKKSNQRPTQLSKQTSGNMYKQKSLLNFLEQDVQDRYTPDKITKEAIKAQPHKKLDNNFNPNLSSSKSVVSARTGTVNDVGGPNKFIKSETSNSIWDNDKLTSLIGKQSSKEKTTSDKEVIANNKRTEENKRMEEYASALKNTDQRKDSIVKSSHESPSTTKYNAPGLGMSIFDKQLDYNRIPEKTFGERVIEHSKQSRVDSKKDPRILRAGKSSKEIVNNLFNSLIEKDK